MVVLQDSILLMNMANLGASPEIGAASGLSSSLSSCSAKDPELDGSAANASRLNDKEGIPG